MENNNLRSIMEDILSRAKFSIAGVEDKQKILNFKPPSANEAYIGQETNELSAILHIEGFENGLLLSLYDHTESKELSYYIAECNVTKDTMKGRSQRSIKNALNITNPISNIHTDGPNRGYFPENLEKLKKDAVRSISESKGYIS